MRKPWIAVVSALVLCAGWVVMRGGAGASREAALSKENRRADGAAACGAGHPSKRLLKRDREAARAAGAMRKADLLVRYPALAVERHSVPDSENGFRLMFELLHGGLLMTDSLREMTGDSTPFDLEKAKRALAENATLVRTLEQFASLAEASGAGMPPAYDEGRRWIPSSDFMEASKILLLKARVAAREGNSDEAFRMVDYGRNLAGHLRGLENGTLLTETVGLRMESQVDEVVMGDLLPLMMGAENLRRWIGSLSAGKDLSPQALADAYRNEWHAMMDVSLFSQRLDKEGPAEKGGAPTIEQRLVLADAMADLFNERVQWLDEQSGMEGLSSMPPMDPGRYSTNLDPATFELLQTAMMGAGSASGYLSAASDKSMSLAALELLLLEHTGTKLTAGHAQSVRPDPASGQSFVFDPSTRTLTSPDGRGKPIVLP